MNRSPRQPFWKRKRWIAVAIASLLACYPLSIGPFMYAFYMDWVPDAAMPVVEVVYGPLAKLSVRWPAFGEALNDYSDWWFEVSVRHQQDQYASPPISEGYGTGVLPAATDASQNQ